MPLLDALLLDPFRMNVWIAARNDRVAGTGTHNDPYDGSTQAKFDALMSTMPTNTCVHLGPGVFQTNGYADGVRRSRSPQRSRPRPPDATNANPVRFWACDNAQFLANQTSAGGLIQGFNNDTKANVSELSNVEDAAILAI
jgi:hypothetical protein